MKKIGLEEKFKEEICSGLDKDEIILRQQAQIETLASSLNTMSEELKSRIVETDTLKEEIKCKDDYILSLEQFIAKIKDGSDKVDTINDFLELTKENTELKKENATLRRQVSYLELFASKKSEKQPRKTKSSENESSKADTNATTKKDSKNVNNETKERKQGKHNGNNGARINKHEFDNIKTETIVVEPVFPKNIDMSTLEHMNTKTVVKFTTETKIIVTRLEYLVKKYKDKKTGVIYEGKVPDTPLNGSQFTSAFVALVMYLKFAVHISVNGIKKMLGDSCFNISSKTLNGFVTKVSKSQFFKNLDKVLQLAIMQSSYIMMDETYAKAKTNIAKKRQQFVKQFYIWVQLSMDIGLVRFSSSGGSRKCSIGYALLEKFKGLVQSDAFVFYKNLEKKILPAVKRIACVQHTKRGFVKLVDTVPEAEDVLFSYNKLYMNESERERLAAADERAGKTWTLEEHISWRNQHAQPILDEIEAKLNKYNNDPNIPPNSKFAKAVRHALNEMSAVRAIFEQEHVLCRLDTNDLEICNRSVSKFRRINLAFGSESAGENQSIFFSLTESCRIHNVNVQEYFKFLFDKMSSMNNYVINDYNSPKYIEFRNLLPDIYAKEHPPKSVEQWKPTIDETKPIHEGAKRKAYKKGKGKKSQTA